jgi:hypothetical protein
MHILKPITSAQEIEIIPRESNAADVSLHLKNESTNQTQILNPTITQADGFMTLSAEFSLVSGVFYGLKVFNGSTLIYRDRVFVTSQTDFDKFSVNEGVYIKEESFNNDFVIL